MKPVALIAFLLATTSAPAAPDLILAETWQGQDVRGWAMSEKLDGVRAYWDGHQLNSRAGYPFQPPAGFLADYPPWPLDGELYRAAANSKTPPPPCAPLTATGVASTCTSSTCRKPKATSTSASPALTPGCTTTRRRASASSHKPRSKTANTSPPHCKPSNNKAAKA